MTPVFADAWYYIALLSQDDAGHEVATRWSRQIARPVVLTEFVLLEVGDAFSRGAARGRFAELVRRLDADPHTTIVPATHDLLRRGLRLFAERPDKDWSRTDCISFVVMGREGLSDALTADHHVAQAGFNILLK